MMGVKMAVLIRSVGAESEGIVATGLSARKTKRRFSQYPEAGRSAAEHRAATKQRTKTILLILSVIFQPLKLRLRVR